MAVSRPRANRRVAGHSRLEGVLGGGGASSVGVYSGGGGSLGGGSLADCLGPSPVPSASSSPARVGVGIGGVAGVGGGGVGGGGVGGPRRNGVESAAMVSQYSSAAATTKQGNGLSGGECYSSDEFEEEDLPLP